MNAHLVAADYSPDTVMTADPHCGDFCDLCGDCLHCYGEDPCYDPSGTGEHSWVVYADQREEWLADHPDATSEDH